MTQRVCYEQGLQLHLGKKGLVETARGNGDGGCSPLPSWKLYENPFYDGLAAAVVAAASAAAAVAMAGKQQEGVANEEDHTGEDRVVQKRRYRNTARASSASPPANRPTLASVAEHRRGEKVSWLQNQGLKGGASSVANAGRSSGAAVQRASPLMTGKASMTICTEEARTASAMADEDVSPANTHRPMGIGMQGASGNGVNVHMLHRGLTPQDLKAGDRARCRATSKANVLSRHGASTGRTEPHCEEVAMAMVDRTLVECDDTLLDTKSMSMGASCKRMESPCSPRSHLQPRPPSSTSDSPCSSKPIKVTCRLPLSPFL
ncbi:hypothetical protein L7F22_047344 [Adiantum nelumboides]|nr:hypothetical protein [Adiantum nelumboides]